MTNFYQVILNVVVSWAKISNQFMEFMTTKLWATGCTPIELLTFGGILILIPILVLHLIA